MAEVLLLDVDAVAAKEMVSVAPGSYRGFVPFRAGGAQGWPASKDLEEAAGGFLEASQGNREEPRVGGYAEDEGEVATPRAAPAAPAPRPGKLPVVSQEDAGDGGEPPLSGLAARGSALPQGRGRIAAGSRPLAAEVDELRRKLRALKASRALVEPPGADAGLGPADMAAPAAPGQGPQLFAEGERVGLGAGELRRLLGVAGTAPPGLADPARFNQAASAAAAAVPVAPSSPPRAASGSSTDPPALSAPPPPDPMLQMLMHQNQLLMQLLASKESGGSRGPTGSVDELLGGNDGSLLDDSKVSGARGCAARVALRQQLSARPAAGANTIRRNLAQAMDRSVEALLPGDMRRYFSAAVPFGSYMGLTYYGFLVAKLWEEAEEIAAALAGAPETSPELKKAFERLHLTVGLGCVFAEQVATEGGAVTSWAGC